MHSPRSSARREQCSSATPPQQPEPLPAPIPSGTMPSIRRNSYSMPRDKNEQRCMYSFGSHRICGVWVYLHAHPCSNILNKADEMLSTRLINHITLTMTIGALEECCCVMACVGKVPFVEPAS